MNVVEKTIDRLFDIEGGKKGYAVFTINNNIVLSSEVDEIIDHRPEIQEIKSAAPDNINAVNDFIAGTFSIIPAEYGYVVSIFYPLFCNFMDIDLGPARKYVPSVSPIKNQNFFATERKISRGYFFFTSLFFCKESESGKIEREKIIKKVTESNNAEINNVNSSNDQNDISNRSVETDNKKIHQ